MTQHSEHPAIPEQLGAGGFERRQQTLAGDQHVGQFSDGGETLPDDGREGQFSDSVDVGR